MARVIVQKLDGAAVAWKAGGGASCCMLAAGCNKQRGRGGIRQQGAAATVGGGRSPDVGDRSIPVVEELVVKLLLPIIDDPVDVVFGVHLRACTLDVV